MRRHSSACHSACSAQKLTSPTLSASGLPWSSVIARPMSPERSRASSATLRSTLLRSSGEVFFQLSNARAAAASARSRSSRVACGSLPMISPLAGLNTSCSRRPSPLMNWPSM
jgi:hypothetical protein